MKKLIELKGKVSALQTEIDELRAKAESGEATSEDVATVKAKLEEKKIYNDEIKTLEALEADHDEIQDSVKPEIQVQGPAAEQTPYSLGNYMQDIVKAASGYPQTRVTNYQQKVYEERRIQAAATGASENVPSEGGFLVGTDMSGTIAERAYNNSELAPRADRYTLSTTANSVEVLGNDETSRADGYRHGGIRNYWIGEAVDSTASKPKWKKDKLTLKKNAILMYATDELVADAALLQNKAEEYVSDELGFALQDGMINGTGAMKPLGILQSDCLVSVAKETGQVADTIVYENTTKMVSRFWGSDKNAIFIANRDIYPQLAVLNVAVGTGGAPVWIPANGAAGAPLHSLHGYPLIFIEQCATVGTVGDLILCDFSQYRLADKGGVQAAMSIHVEFVADEIVFRWINRVDGQPAWSSALTPYKGGSGQTRSPFVAIASRD